MPKADASGQGRVGVRNHGGGERPMTAPALQTVWNAKGPWPKARVINPCSRELSRQSWDGMMQIVVKNNQWTFGIDTHEKKNRVRTPRR